MNKTENIVIRVTPETKQKMFQKATSENLSVSQYILKHIDNSVPLHEESVSSCVVINQVMNILHNQTCINKEVLEKIERELVNYVKC